MKTPRGFTLVELLVALFITAIVFALGYGSINQAIKNREGLKQQQDRLVAVQRTIRLLVQDLAQAAPRPVRDEIGSSYEPALIGNSASGTLLTLTRAGWANPAGVQRASLQRVRYVFAQGKLRREARPELDAVAAAPSRGRDLLDGVKSVRMRFMNDGLNWQDTWPPPGAAGALSKQERRWRPVAVEVTLELEDWGRIRRVIEVTN
jgi:general secretion pathway protein J